MVVSGCCGLAPLCVCAEPLRQQEACDAHGTAEGARSLTFPPGRPAEGSPTGPLRSSPLKMPQTLPSKARAWNSFADALHSATEDNAEDAPRLCAGTQLGDDHGVRLEVLTPRSSESA